MHERPFAKCLNRPEGCLLPVFTRKRMTFVNTTVIAYGQKMGRTSSIQNNLVLIVSDRGV